MSTGELRGLARLVLAHVFVAGLATAAAADEDVGMLAERAFAAYKARRYEAALVDLRRLLETSYPYQSVVWWNIAKSLEALDRAEESLAAWRAYLQFEGEPAARLEEARTAIARIQSTAPGSLHVECDGKDMSLRLGQAAPVPCPVRLERLAPGKHELTVLAGSESLSRREVSVAAGKVTQVRIEAPARLELVANLEGARVKVGDRSRGTTPVDPFLLAPGAYKVDVDASGHQPFSRVVELGPGVVHQLDVRLEPVRDPPPAAGRGAGPWIMVAAGVAGVGAGFGFQQAQHAAIDEGNIDASDRYTALSISGYALGGAVLAAGATWLLWPE